MKNLLHKPHIIFWSCIPILLAMGYFSNYETLDINVHDTYFVIERGAISILFSIIFVVTGLLYWLAQKFNRKLFRSLTYSYIILTLGGLIILRFVSFVFNFKTNSNNPLIDDLVLENIILTLTVLLIVFAQLLFIINLISGLFRANKT